MNDTPPDGDIARALARVIPALDVPSLEAVGHVLAQLRGTARWAKIGLELHGAVGESVIARVAEAGLQVMLDLKLHDIPRTVERAVHAHLRQPGVGLLTVHASGGRAMLAAATGAAHAAAHPARVLAVTVLTSLDDEDAREIFGVTAARERVLSLARLAQDAGADGVVASPQEAAAIRAATGPGFLIVTPGIRPAGAGGADDQKRVATAAVAARHADFLVVGRPIVEAADPRAALRAVAGEIAAGAASAPRAAEAAPGA